MTGFFESATHIELREKFIKRYSGMFFILPEERIGRNMPDARIYDDNKIFYVDFYTEASMGFDADRLFRKIYSYSKHSDPVVIVVKEDVFDGFLMMMGTKYSTIDLSSRRFFWKDKNAVLCPLKGGGLVELVGI